MKTIRKIFGLVAAVGTLLSVHAADLSTNASAGIGGLIYGKSKVNMVTVQNSSGGTAIVHLFDAPGSSTTYTNAAYTVMAQSAPSSLVTTYTNIFGTVENWTNTAITTASSSVSAITNNFPKFVQFNIANGASASWTPSSPTYTTFGLLSSNSAAVTITVNYNR